MKRRRPEIRKSPSSLSHRYPFSSKWQRRKVAMPCAGDPSLALYMRVLVVRSSAKKILNPPARITNSELAHPITGDPQSHQVQASWKEWKTTTTMQNSRVRVSTPLSHSSPKASLRISKRFINNNLKGNNSRRASKLSRSCSKAWTLWASIWQ